MLYMYICWRCVGERYLVDQCSFALLPIPRRFVVSQCKGGREEGSKRGIEEGGRREGEWGVAMDGVGCGRCSYRRWHGAMRSYSNA